MSENENPFHIFEFIKRRKINFQLACNQPAMQEMLIDLAKFCRAGETSVVKDKLGKVDVEQTLLLEGRREVWLRIQNHLNLNTQQLYFLFTGKQFNTGDDNG
jgi:hypothetical protein